MKLTIFDRKKYSEAITSLEFRKAPTYVIEAYKEGYSNVVNAYYRNKINIVRGKKSITEGVKFMYSDNWPIFLKEARKSRDTDFIKAFFKMTNLDMVSGNRLPPNASKLIKQGVVKDLGLSDLYKKLK